MKRIPWKGLAMGCGILAVLVVFRCVITAGRFLYYGGTYWQQEVMADPWLYIGMAAAAGCVAALLVLSDQADRKEKAEQIEEDGCE